MPKISVVMPAYNAERYIAEAIDSILNQTYHDFEFIIINDGSTDKTEEIILSYEDPRIVYIKNEKNMGIVYTLNRGLDAAKGEFIARMDSDDISLPTRFQEQITFLLNNPNVAVLGTAINIFGDGITSSVFENSTAPEKAKAELFFSSSLAHPTVIIRKSVLDKHNLRYKEDFAGMEDYRLWWEISQHSDIMSLSAPLLNYRKHSSQITASNSKQKTEKSKQFLAERLAVFNITYSQKEFDSLFNYQTANFSIFTLQDIENITCLFKKLLKANKKQKHFSLYHFKKILGLAVTYSISFLNISDDEKFSLRHKAFKNGVLSLELFLKLLLHKILKR